EGDRTVLDFLRTVPAQQVKHRRIRVRLVQPLRVEDPLPQERGDVLDSRDERSPLHQPLLGATARVITIAENFVEQVTDLASVVASVQTVGIEMVQHPLVRVRVHRLLTDETKY